MPDTETDEGDEDLCPPRAEDVDEDLEDGLADGRVDGPVEVLN